MASQHWLTLNPCLSVEYSIAVQPFWYYGVKQILQKWHDNPNFARLRMEADLERKGGYMDADEFKRLDAFTGGLFSAPTSRTVHLGLDWGQVFKTALHSTGIVVLRYELNLRAIASCAI